MMKPLSAPATVSSRLLLCHRYDMPELSRAAANTSHHQLIVRAIHEGVLHVVILDSYRQMAALLRLEGQWVRHVVRRLLKVVL